MRFEEKPAMFRAAQLYQACGAFYNKIENFDMAIDAYEKSIKEAGSEDLKTLLGLCQAFTNSMRYREAADVALKCKEIDSENYLVKWMWVKTLFKIGEFERSLIEAHRGYRKTKLPFELAVYQANETIEDCVGSNTSPEALVELYPWIKELENHRRNLIAKLSEEEDEFEGIDEDHSRFKVNDPEYKLEEHLKSLDIAKGQIYLGELVLDKHFILDLLDNPEICSPNKFRSAELCKLAEDSAIRTSYRQEVLRTRKPLYAFTLEKEKSPETHKLNRKNEKRLMNSNAIVDAATYFKKLRKARKKGDYLEFFRTVETAKDSIDNWDVKELPIKKQCLNELYELVGWTYTDPRDVTGITDESTRLRYLKHHLGIRVAALPRDSQLGWVNVLSRKRALATFRRRLAYASEPPELAFLFHELAKFFVSTKRYDMARFYAKKCRDASYQIKSDLWTLNAHHLMIKIEIHQHNKNEARESAVLAYLGAQRLGLAHLQDFYRKIVKLVNEFDVTMLSTEDGITTREKLIIELMPDELKTEAEVLIQDMRSIPARRRISVMPGCKPVDYELSKTSQKNSIVPEASRDPKTEARKQLLKRFAPSKKIPGFVDFEDYE